MARRKDHKGQVLHENESQRSNMSYQYRYTDMSGKRHTIYAKDLKTLRAKEENIGKMILHKMDYSFGATTVYELVKQTVDLMPNLRTQTLENAQTVLNHLSVHPFGQMKIRDVKTATAKSYYLYLNQVEKKKRATIKQFHWLLRAAFQSAYEDEFLTRNPFAFSLSFLPNDSVTRRALTSQEQESLLQFLQTNTFGKKHYDMFVILLGTGLRVSELCGLTRKDVDMESRIISIDHQLLRDLHGKFYVERPKTQSGIRKIPMTDPVFSAFERVLEYQYKADNHLVVDGYTDFLFLSREGIPRDGRGVEAIVKRMLKNYNREHPDTPISTLTPHVLRHTFCTNLILKGVNLKSVQYLMGHAQPTVSMSIYAHVNADIAVKDLLDTFLQNP